MIFLFRQIDNNFAFSGKLEDEIIAMFKHFRYPYSISKTGLVAVGSPHTWPALLAAITWIIELLAYDEETANNAANDVEYDADDPAASEKVFYNYLKKAYSCFLSGNDDMFSKLEEQFVQTFESKTAEISNQIKIIEEENALIDAELGTLMTRIEYLPKLREKKRDYLKDLAKFQQLVEQLEKHKEQLELKVSSRKVELSRVKSSIQSAEEEVEALKARVATQELSVTDVQRMNEEKERLQINLESATETRAALQKRVWEAERTLRERVTALEDLGHKYTAVL